MQSSYWSMVVVIPKSWHLETPFSASVPWRNFLVLHSGNLTPLVSSSLCHALCRLTSVVNTVEHLLGAEGYVASSLLGRVWGAWQLFYSHGLFPWARVSLATRLLQKRHKYCCLFSGRSICHMKKYQRHNNITFKPTLLSFLLCPHAPLSQLYVVTLRSFSF